ncbi:hypothetical protein, partial [Alkalibacillus haloalkaliphilus]|uniref:hypothetical protein n=1 Tax=Alkalibacillus haloalkaliphilus TaxID=94136 RepID=UPI002936A825
GPVVQPLTVANSKRKAENVTDVLQGMKKRFKKSYAAASAPPKEKDVENFPHTSVVSHTPCQVIGR